MGYQYRGKIRDLNDPWPEPDRPLPPVKDCGKPGGRAAHLRRNEEPCNPCTEAYLAYQEAYRAAKKAKAA